MSWAIRAHIRNVMLKASLGASFASSAELKAGSAALCSVEMCPYPGYSETQHKAPPTDDKEFCQKMLKLAFDNCRTELRISSLPHSAARYLEEKMADPRTINLIYDLFWWRYLHNFGVKYALKHPTGNHLESFRAVLTDMFIETDVDGSGEVDAGELSDILSGLGIQLPEELCYSLIQLVDENGNGQLDLEEFLEMMCVEVIADCGVDQVKADAERYRLRCCRQWCDLFSPRGNSMDLQNRDRTSASFCRILARTIYSCFVASFNRPKTGPDPFGAFFRIQLEEEFALMLLGARRPNLPPSAAPPARPASARTPRPPAMPSRLSTAFRPLSASVKAGPVSPARQGTGLVSPRSLGIAPSVQSLGTIDVKSLSSDDVESVASSDSGSSDSVGSILLAMHKAARPHLQQPAPQSIPRNRLRSLQPVAGPESPKQALRRSNSSFVRPSAARRMRLQEQLPDEAVEAPLPPKTPGQPPPPVPVLNMLGTSPAFNVVFPTNPPSQRLHTIQREHYASDYVPGKYTARLEIAERQFHEKRAKAAPRKAANKLLDADDDKGESSARLVMKHSRKLQKELADRRSLALRTSKEIYAEMMDRWALAQPCLKPNGEDMQDRPADLAAALADLRDDFYGLMAGPSYRGLSQAERNQVRSVSSKISHVIASLNREAAHRRCRITNKSMMM